MGYGVPPKNVHGDLQQRETAISADASANLGLLEGGRHWGASNAPGGAVPRWVGARSLPPALVAWGATVPTLASPGTPLAAAAKTGQTSDHTPGNANNV